MIVESPDVDDCPPVGTSHRRQKSMNEELLEMVSADSTKDEFREKLRTVSPQDVDQHPSPVTSPKTPFRPMTRLSSDDVFALDASDPAGRPRDVRPGTRVSGLVLRDVPARPRAPKTARDRGWARLFGLALVLGVACLAYEPPPLDRAAACVALAASAAAVEGLAVRAWARGAPLASAALAACLARLAVAGACALRGASARSDEAAAFAWGGLACVLVASAAAPAARRRRVRSNEAFAGAVRAMAAGADARHGALGALVAGAAAAQAGAVGLAVAAAAPSLPSLGAAVAAAWLCGVLRLLAFAAACGAELRAYASADAAPASELGGFRLLSTSLGSLAQAAVALPAAAAARWLLGRRRRDAAPLAAALTGRERGAARLASLANAATDLGVAHVAVHHKAFRASAVAVDGVLGAGGARAALRDDDDAAPGFRDAAGAAADALAAVALLVAARPVGVALAVALCARVAGALVAAPYVAAVQSAYLASLECPRGLAKRAPLIYQRLRRLADESRADARRDRQAVASLLHRGGDGDDADCRDDDASDHRAVKFSV